MKTIFFLLIAFFFCGLHLFSQISKKPLVAKPVINAPAAQKISARVPNADLVRLQKAVVNIVVGDDGKDKDSKLSIAIYVTAKNLSGGDQDEVCASYKGSTETYLPGENVTIPTNLNEIAYISGTGLPSGQQKLADREVVFSDFSNGGDIDLRFQTTNDVWKIKSLTVSLFFDNDPVTPYKITWTNIRLSHDTPAVDLHFDKNFRPIQLPIKNIYKGKTNL